MSFPSLDPNYEHIQRTRWIDASNHLSCASCPSLMVMIQGLGNTSLAIEAFEEDIFNTWEKPFDPEKEIKKQPWFSFAEYWAKQAFDILAILNRLEGETRANKERVHTLIKNLNLLRQPLAKNQTAHCNEYQWAQPVLFPQDRCFGWIVFDKEKKQHNFSRRWIIEKILTLYD